LPFCIKLDASIIANFVSPCNSISMSLSLNIAGVDAVSARSLYISLCHNYSPCCDGTGWKYRSPTTPGIR
jgi:hypothetical protein